MHQKFQPSILRIMEIISLKNNVRKPLTKYYILVQGLIGAFFRM